MKDKPIFSPQVAAALIDQGFKMKNITPNYRDPSKRVYYFEDTEELQVAFRLLMEGRENG